MWDLALYALASVFIFTAVVSLVGYSPTRKSKGVLQDYLLAGGALTRWPVLNLLLSSSFGINTMLYQGYLGATVGWWGLVVQAGWSVGFFLLMPHVNVIRTDRGIHHFLGIHFGAATRVIAAIFSIIGITVFLGWETSIGKDALQGILSHAGMAATAPAAANWLLLGTVGGCLLYTLLGGLRGNGWANLAQNAFKFVTFSFITVLLGIAFMHRGASFWTAAFPARAAMVANLGWWGLVTSIVFGFAWQFVDTSTWQSLAAAFESPDKELRWNLKWSGYLVFVTPGVLGTVFGVFLADKGGAANAVVAAFDVLRSAPVAVHFLYVAAIIASVLSLIDGLFLACAYALIVDLIHPKEHIEQLDRNEERAGRILGMTRVLLIVIAACSIWGVPLLIRQISSKYDLFFFSFVVVIAQLALLGPVAVGLFIRHRKAAFRSKHMWAAIVIAGVLGFTAAFYGGAHQIPGLTNSAATITMLASLGCAAIIASVKRWRLASTPVFTVDNSEPDQV